MTTVVESIFEDITYINYYLNRLITNILEINNREFISIANVNREMAEVVN